MPCMVLLEEAILLKSFGSHEMNLDTSQLRNKRGVPISFGWGERVIAAFTQDNILYHWVNIIDHAAHKTIILKLTSPVELLKAFSQGMNYASQIVFDIGKPIGSGQLQKSSYHYLRNQLNLKRRCLAT